MGAKGRIRRKSMRRNSKSRRNSKIPLPLKEDYDEGQQLYIASKEGNLSKNTIQGYAEGNHLDWTHTALPDKDDSMVQAIQAGFLKKNARNIKDPRSMAKVRQMLNRNITLKSRQGTNNRVPKVQKLKGALSNSPQNRVLSNIRTRPAQTIEANPTRAATSAVRSRPNVTISAGVKSRLNSKLDQLINKKTEARDRVEDPSKDIIEKYRQLRMNQAILGENSDVGKPEVSRNQAMKRVFSNDSRVVPNPGDFSGSTIRYGPNSNDVSGCLSDKSYPKALQGAAKYLEPLDGTVDIPAQRNKQRHIRIDARKQNESVRKTKFKLDLAKNLKEKLGTSGVSTASNLSGKKTVNGKEIRIVKKKNKKTKSNSKTKDSSFVGEDSICKVMSNETEASYQANMDKSLPKKLQDSSLKYNLSNHTGEHNALDKSGLERIEEEKNIQNSERNEGEALCQDFEKASKKIKGKKQKRIEFDDMDCGEEGVNPKQNDNFISERDQNVEEEKIPTSIAGVGDLEDDFMSKSRVSKKKNNNLLQMLSNDDYAKISNTIMSDLRQSQIAERYEPKLSQKESLDESQEMEQEEELCIGGLPVAGNIFYPYQEKEANHERYANVDDDDEVILD